MLLPPHIRFGTSTWTYEGWQGLVYRKAYPKGRFKQDCLAEYAAYEYRGERHFRTVGFDFTFYGPPTVRQLAHYAAQVPADFVACSKVWEEITVPSFGTRPRSGITGPNPHFLDADYFRTQVLPPYEQAFQAHTGPFIFEFQRTGIEPDAFLARLAAFLPHLPDTYQYAVEVRNPRLLGPAYAGILRRHGVAHVYNHFTAMPPLWRQYELLGGAFTGPFVVFRLLTPVDMRYEEAVRAYRPYSRVVRPLPQMRTETVRLLHEATAQRLPSYVLVNNRAEGCAPLTIQAIVDEFSAP